MLVQNIKHSYNMVSRKYTNFVSFFFLVRQGTCPWYNTNLQSKIRDANKCDTHSCKLVSKSQQVQYAFFKNKYK